MDTNYFGCFFVNSRILAFFKNEKTTGEKGMISFKINGQGLDTRMIVQGKTNTW
jgi:hypothetical protein